MMPTGSPAPVPRWAIDQDSGPAGAPGCTVTGTSTLRPGAAAVTVAPPGLSPRTAPVALTVAIPCAPDVQVIAEPGMATPFESAAVAVSCCVSPTITVSGDGATVSVAAICRDRTATVSATAPEVAMTTPLPVASEVTFPPVADTMVGVVVLHVIAGLGSAT